MGTYYGSAIKAIDLNNDGYADLLVGAPLYTEVQDEGRVYVYINNGAVSLNPSCFHQFLLGCVLNEDVIEGELLSLEFSSRFSLN